MLQLDLIPFKEFGRIGSSTIDDYDKLNLIADMCRANTLMSVKKAGSGHLGSSFSAMDIVVFLYHRAMNTIELGLEHPDRDFYFSSKGHDVPGFYAVLHSLGILPQDKILNLRRLGGLDGHPDVKIPGVEANSGSLGMGISKARGMAFAKQVQGSKGRVFVLTGDGELQEGQIWESMQTTAHQKVNNINVIVDFNKIQSDKVVREINDLGNLEEKFSAFGWHVERCDGHDFVALNKVLEKFDTIEDKPKILLADTIKGRGISFMEGTGLTQTGGGLYEWHSGAPDDDAFEAGHNELVTGINNRLNTLGLKPLSLVEVEKREKGRVRLKDVAEKVVTAYGEALVELGKTRKDMIVLDADLSADCGLRPFEESFPEQFVENGIAEQDMVSMAGGMALQGLLPVVNSFGVFLSSRANEQIYNNASEGTKIIYTCHFSGLIPAGPGKSHQSLRDISLFGALPNCVVIEPCNTVETKAAVEWCVNDAKENCMLRLQISPSPRTVELPLGYTFSPGKGSVLKEGGQAVLFSYGPVMINEALTAAELLEKDGFSLKVVNMPWLNQVDIEWLEKTIHECESIFVLDNHSPYGGLGDAMLNGINSSSLLKTKGFHKFGVEGYPACGTPVETLAYHKLDGKSLASRILANAIR